VFSLHLEDDTPFVGPYRLGGGAWPERREDLYGLGLQAVNIRTSAVRDVTLPEGSLAQTDWLVTWVGSSPEDGHALRVVLWQPWKSYNWDYQQQGSGIVKPAGYGAPIEHALDALNLGSDTLIRSRVRGFLARHQ
jgi:hypothetical protein